MDINRNNLRTAVPEPGEEIVISGITGRFPNSDSIAELEYNLYNKIDMCDDDERRWRHENADIPQRSGKVRNLEKFDANFFGISFKQTHTMDPQSRMLLEHTHEALLDAGINPKSLKGTRTGVYIAVCFSEVEKTWYYDKTETGGYAIVGCSRNMLPNRISYTYGLQGPSFLIDTACSSSMYAIDVAFSAIRMGQCDAAIVGGTNLQLHPYITLQFARLGVLALNGYCRPFDEKATGYTRSEAVSVIFLQKAKDAKRVYATVVHSKTNCDGYKDEGITYPSGKMQCQLLTEFYNEISIKPETVDYVEAHSTGTVVGDPEECNALDKIYCDGKRTKPLPVGSVKSNLGHSEASAGLCSIAKIVLSFEKQLIPPNINFTNCRPTIPSLVENRLRVITEVEPLDGPLIGVNSFGFGGANAHTLLRGNCKVKVNNGTPLDKLPRLVTWAGRTESACNSIFDLVASRPLDAELVGLMHGSQSETYATNIVRGYALFSHVAGGNAKCISRDVQHFSGIKRAIVYVFSGMGSQWTEIGTSLMEIPVFRKTIEKCHRALTPKGINLIEIITSKDSSTVKSVFNSFLGISAVQAGICDVLELLGLESDLIIGHSIGELGCAYADKCLTAEEMVLCAYYIGLTCAETKPTPGAMAEIAVGYRKIQKILPPKIDIAFRDGPDSCTVSGPVEDVNAFISKIKADGVVVREIRSSNIPYNSRYMENMRSKLSSYLSKIIQNPKKRSQKWLSSSVSRSEWNLSENQLCSAQYLTNILLGPVLFDEASAPLPPNALTIEIGSHGLIQTLLRKSRPSGLHIPLTERDSPDNLNFFLSSLGRIFTAGVDMVLDRIYPAVEFPVSRGTPMIASHVKWDHSDDWFVHKFETLRSKSGEKKCAVALTDADHDYVSGHVIDGRCLFPATGYLQIVWDVMAQIRGVTYTHLNVEFTDVRFLRATHMVKESLGVQFIVMIQGGTGRFEITEGSAAVVTGHVRVLEEKIELTELPPPKETDDPMLQAKDFYKELRLRGYHYNGLFRNVVEARADGATGKIKWGENWVAFMDNMLQLGIVGSDTRALYLPTRIEKMTIDTQKHLSLLANLTPEQRRVHIMDAQSNKNLMIIQSGGIEIKGLHVNMVSRRKPPGVPVLETYKFIPHIPTPELSVIDAARFCVQVALENQASPKVKIVECITTEISPLIKEFQLALEDLPLVTGDLLILTPLESIESGGIEIENSNLQEQQNSIFILKASAIKDLEFIEQATKSLTENGYLIFREEISMTLDDFAVPSGYNLIAMIPTETHKILMLQKAKRKIIRNIAIVPIASNDVEFKWLETLKQSIKNGPTIAVAQNEKMSGILGLMNCIRKEPGGNGVTCVFIDDETAPPFNLDDAFYKNQLALEMGINIYRNGQWGTYRHLALEYIKQHGPTDQHAFVNMQQKGDLSSLKFFHGNLNNRITMKENVVKIAYSSLNFRDAMLATGKLAAEVVATTRLDHECVLGFEYSGIDQNGRRVMGMGPGSMATHNIARDGLTWEIPASWSLEDAATVPVVYFTVYASFFLHSRIERGKSILIHAGTGGIGLAAIRIALAYGLDVFTTVSTTEKREFLLKEFPELKDNHIGNSRDLSFERMIKLETEGKGVDFVLNSLAQEKLHASIRCLGEGGCFLEIGKFDIANDTKIGLGEFIRNISFCVVLVDNVFHASIEEKMVLHSLIQNGIDLGYIKPLPATSYPAGEVEQAFRFLASGKHIGKVLLKYRENDTDNMTYPITVLPHINCDPELSYIIPGGLGGFGLELADWMAIRGARKIVLSSSRGITKPYQAYRIKIWKGYGCEIKVDTSDITTYEGCEQLIRNSMKLGPVGGIFNLAVVLRDSILENQSEDKFKESFGPKAYATKYLDQVSRKLCPLLRYFVIFSSVSCGRGNAGQSNYGMSNSIMERIIEQRYQDGLPAKAIQWGAVGEVGLVADMQEDKLDMEIGGTLQQRISSCLQELDPLLSSPDPVVASMVVAEKRASGLGGGNVVEVVMNIMSIRDIKSVSMDATLSELGMDSLMAVEIKQTLEREFELFLTPADLRTLTFGKLQALQDAHRENAENVNLDLDSGEGLVGMHMLLRNLGDEKNSGKTVLRLESQDNAEDFKDPVLLVPGIEGVAGKAWYNIASTISNPTFCLQLTKTIPLLTVSEIANEIYEAVRNEVFSKSETFYLVAYSFGALVTLELAYLLEQSGLKGKVVLIDGSPLFLKKVAMGQITTETSDDYLQTILCAGIIRVIFPEENPEDLYMRIGAIPTWEQRVDKLIELSKDQTVYSEDYLRKVTYGFYNRVKVVIGHSVDEEVKKLKSSITLIRPTEVSVADIDEDYELDNYTEGTVELKFIEGNHATMLENPKLSILINEMRPV